MSFIDNIFSSAFLEPFPKEPPSRILLLGDNAGYFEHVKSIVSYSDTEIVLSIKKEEVSIAGENLIIKKFCEGDVVICGKIFSIKKG